MLSGVMSSDNVSSVLRSISQRRATGILELSYPEREAQIFFVAGKIADVHFSDSDPNAEVVELLKAADYLQQDFSAQAESYTDLLELLVGGGGKLINEEIFRRCIKQRVLNHLYSMQFDAGPEYAFKIQMVDLDRDFITEISVGQLLLDLVSLESDQDRFDSIFVAGSFVYRNDRANEDFTEEEGVLYRLIGDAGIALDELIPKSMLSKYQLLENLLGMHEQDIVYVVQDGLAQEIVLDAGPDGASYENFMEALESSIDQAFEEQNGDTSSEPLVEAPPMEEISDKIAQIEDLVLPADDDLEELIVEDEIESLPVGSDISVQINSLLLYSVRVPQVVTILIFLATLLGPWIFWSGPVLYFSH